MEIRMAKNPGPGPELEPRNHPTHTAVLKSWVIIAPFLHIHARPPRVLQKIFGRPSLRLLCLPAQKV